MLLPSISFQENCEEAINYYKEVLGAEVKEISYLDEAPVDLGIEISSSSRFVTYAEVVLFGTSVVMTDGAENQMKNQNFYFTLFFDTEEEVRIVFDKLADGGKIVEPLAPKFWARLDGNIVDRFGINWSVLTRESAN